MRSISIHPARLSLLLNELRLPASKVTWPLFAGTLDPPRGSVDPNDERASMPDKRFAQIVEVELGVVRSVNSARSAAQALLDVRWPRRGQRHRVAVETCLKILNGQRPAIDAQSAFVAAAREGAFCLTKLPLPVP